MTLIFLATLALARPPVDVVTTKVGEGITLRLKGDRTSLYFTDSTDSFLCSTWPKGMLAAWPGFIDKVVSEAAAHPNADFGNALSGYNSYAVSRCPGMCDLGAVTHDGTIFITLTHTDGCYGQAGCLYSRVTLFPSSEELQQFRSILVDLTK